MFYSDHPPPHFHVRYGRHKALIEIRTLAVLDGSLPPRALGLVIEWAASHRTQLLSNWNRARRHETLHRIPPLE